MKEDKIFRAMSNIDEELVNEAVNLSSVRRRNIVKYAGIASAVVLTAILAALLLYVHKSLNRKAEFETPAVLMSSEEKNAEEKNAEGMNTEEDNAEAKKPEEKNADEESKGQAEKDFHEHISEKTTDLSIDKQTSAGEDEEARSDMLGFIIRDGMTYFQVFNENEYTLDEQIGFVGDYEGAYRDLKDGSAVYTVKEDEKILVVKFASGGTVTLMLWEGDKGYYTFHGLRVDRSLMAALLSSDDKTYSVYITRPDSEDMYEYQYHGRSIGEIRQELEESWKTADGKNNPVEKEYQEALDAFLSEKIHTVYEILSTNGIKAELVSDFRCEAEMTKEQFEALGDAGINLEEYAFGLMAGNVIIDDYDA